MNIFWIFQDDEKNVDGLNNNIHHSKESGINFKSNRIADIFKQYRYLVKLKKEKEIEVIYNNSFKRIISLHIFSFFNRIPVVCNKNEERDIEKELQHRIAYSRRRDIPVLMYHRVIESDDEKGYYDTFVTKENFEKQMKYLKKNNYEPIFFKDIKNGEYKNRFNKKNVIITFDDGYRDNYKIVLPILKKYNFKIVLFLITDCDHNKWDVEAEGREKEKRFPLMTKAEVQELIDWADVVILAIGGSSSRFGGALFDNNGAAVVQGTQKDISIDSDLVRKNKEAWAMDCGEGMDSSTLSLPGDQLDWFLFVRESKKPLVSIVVAGRPYAISKIALKTDALLYSFYPGPYGGLALAQLLYGQESPSGRLPISIPAHVGQLPVYYNPKRSYEAMKYWDEEDHALYEFGEGFGYGQLSYENMTLQKEIDHGSFAYKVTFSVSNNSDSDDFAVPQLYVRDIAASTVRRVRELKGFTKTSLKAGQTKQISIVLDKDAFTIWNLQMKQVVEPGEFEILLMDQGKIWDRQTITL